MNVRSVCDKTEAIHELIVDREVIIMCQTETWLREGDDPLVADVCPPGYYFVGASRPQHKGNRGGGVGFVIVPVNASQLPTDEHQSFESVAIKI